MVNTGQKKLVVYNSSAGSGKTYTLVKEYLSLALKASSPWYFRKILAITFTNKAAAEMKERVLDHLVQLSQYPPVSEKAKSVLEDYVKFTGMNPLQLSEKAALVRFSMLHHYADISICTIDSFVHRLVRTFSKDLGLVTDFDVETDAVSLIEQAVDQLVSEAGRDKEITQILLEFTRQRTEDEKGWNIEQEIARFAEIILREDSIGPLKKLRVVSPVVFGEIRNVLRKEISETENRLKEICSKGRHIITDKGLTKEDFQFAGSGVAALFYKGADGKLDKLTLEKRFEKVLAEGILLPSDKAKTRKEDIASVSAELVSLLREIKLLADNRIKKYVSAKHLYSRIYHLSLLNEVNRRCEQMKEDKGIVLIADLNRMITEIIRDEPAPFIYERLGERYSHILIDEFQDTSVMQWHNFIPLIENSLAAGNINLLVGDAKQSIYRWRNGEMEQLVNLPGIYPQQNLSRLQKEREKIFAANLNKNELKINYRSRNEIVQFNNAFFRNFYIQKEGDLKKVYDTFHQELPGDRPGGYVEVRIIPKEEKDTTTTYLQWILETIRKNRDAGFSFSEMAVLCRRKQEGSAVAVYLGENNIPVISADSLLLGSSSSAGLLASYLRLSADRNNATAKTLYIENYVSFHGLKESLHHFPDNHFTAVPFPPEGKKQFSWSYSFYQMAEDAVSVLGLSRKDPFLSSLLDHILTFSSRGGYTLTEFTRWWDEKGKYTPAGTASDADAVKILTIHKSKGLQYPLVIFPFVNWKIKKGKEWVWTELRNNEAEQLPVALMRVSKDVMETSGYEDIYEEENEKTIIDQFNLLYVAFTRAEERLYIFTDEKNKGGYMNEDLLRFLPEELNHDGTSLYLGNGDALRIKKDKPEKKKINLPREFAPADWKKHLRISFEVNRNAKEEQARFGNLLHEVLGKINSEDEAERVTGMMVKKGLITPVEESGLIAEAKKLFRSPFIQELFSVPAETKKEFEIADEAGKIYRADRMVKIGGKYRLVDFKTGIRKKEHVAQIKKYGDLLEAAGFSEVEKFLYYTGENEYIKV
ncbi:MAG: UvrD-helicase domain-containing protein [Bacteroidota bacterium]